MENGEGPVGEGDQHTTFHMAAVQRENKECWCNRNSQTDLCQLYSCGTLQSVKMQLNALQLKQKLLNRT